MTIITAPRVESLIGVRGNRELGIAEFGPPDGTAVLWFHGTPGARRQVPEEARRIADAEGIRIIGIDRPGVGMSTPHLHRSVVDHVADVEIVLDRLHINEVSVIGLSGGGPYALALAHELPDRVRAVGILGGVVPTRGPDAVKGGLVGFGMRFAPVMPLTRRPMGLTLTALVRALRPVGIHALNLYARISPEGDRIVLEQPEISSMFIDDLGTNGGKSMQAFIDDAILFTRHWGFDHRAVQQPVTWWHGDADNIVPLSHAQQFVPTLRNAELRIRPGESHLGGLGAAREVLHAVVGR
ncbi:MAG TPA: alpha/beta hydrolase [Acidimicrobiales bacterium]|nr:alpha/beta hydrolase [Acidimicrobiales bacterium]